MIVPSRLFESVEHWARLTPNAEAIVFNERRLTYSQLKDAIDRTAKAFLEFGVLPGDRVAMLAMACPEFVITFLAASKVGAVWLGLNPKFSQRELRYILEDCRPRVLFALDEYGGKNVLDEVCSIGLAECGVEKTVVIGKSTHEVTSFVSLIESCRESLDGALRDRAANVHPSSAALLMYTSGSTGHPKGVLQSHQSILVNVREQTKYFFADQTTRALLHFPINHVAADVEIGFATLHAGGALIMMDRFDPAETLAMLGREKVTMLGQIPAMYLMQAGLPSFSTTDFSSLKVIIWGGAAAPMKLLRGLEEISNAVGAKLLTGYGSTEACGFITYTRPGETLERLATSVGVAPDGFELRIVDEHRQPMSCGTIGELAIRGPFLFTEYLNKPEATSASRDSDGWFYTGDLGFLDSDGALFLSGRKSEMYKTGGENVFPREIEDVLSEHPAVALAAVIGVPDDTFQEVGYALVMRRPGSTVTADELKEHCKARLANFKVPKTYDIRAALPMLPNGKVNKLELKKEIT